MSGRSDPDIWAFSHRMSGWMCSFPLVGSRCPEFELARYRVLGDIQISGQLVSGIALVDNIVCFFSMLHYKI